MLCVLLHRTCPLIETLGCTLFWDEPLPFIAHRTTSVMCWWNVSSASNMKWHVAWLQDLAVKM